MEDNTGAKDGEIAVVVGGDDLIDEIIADLVAMALLTKENLMSCEESVEGFNKEV